MSTQITQIDQADINNIIWQACDTFRGVVDPSEYKNYILVFLFLKYVSDISKEKREAYFIQFNGDEATVNRFMSRERFQIPPESDFYYLYSQRNKTNIGELINTALDNIEDANKQKLEGVFRNIDFNSEVNLGETKDKNTRLKNLLEDFNNPKLDLRSSKIGNLDIIGNSYQYLIEKFASDSGKKGGEFFTPPEVSELLAKLIKPEPEMRIYDPTCGSGSLLIKVAKEAPNHNFSLYGQEINGSTWALCKMNMYLHALDGATIAWGDTIKSPKLYEADNLMKYDIVVANPPFSLDKWGHEEAGNDQFGRFWRGIPPKSKGDYAFICHMIETLNEFGRAGVIVPHGVLFRGSAEGKIRRKLIEDNLLEAVIGLPPALFYGTGIPAAIMIFNKAKKDKKILFIDASREFDDLKNQNKLRSEDIEKITNCYHNKEVIDKYSYLATPKEVSENDYNLNIPRYVDTFEEEEPIDIPMVQAEIRTLQSEIIELEKQMNHYLKELGI